jgi:hypothetical protein
MYLIVVRLKLVHCALRMIEARILNTSTNNIVLMLPWEN